MISNVLNVICELIFSDYLLLSLSYMSIECIFWCFELFYDAGVWWLPLSLWYSLIFLNLYKSMNLMSQLNWHIQRNEHLALELSYDLGLGCSPLFSNSTDYDSSYPWIRLRFVHLMGVRPVQTYCWKTNVSISLPSPTSDNAINMSIEYLIFARFWFERIGEFLSDKIWWKF